MTHMNDANVKHNVMYLIGPKLAILSKPSGKNPKIDLNEKLYLNSELTSNQIRINLIPPKGKKQ